MGDDSILAAANKAGLNQSTLNRQLASGKITAETVIALSSAYKLSPVTGLLQTGYLTADQAKDSAIAAVLEEATDQQLCAEVIRRAARGSVAYDVTVVPVDEEQPLAEVEELYPPANQGRWAAQEYTERDRLEDEHHDDTP